MTWLQAIHRFNIGKIYHEASLDKMENVYQGIADMGRQWVEKPTSLYLSGTPGSGKTYFCMALLRALLESERFSWIIFSRSYELDEELLKAVEIGGEKWILGKYEQVPILFIDDVGVERVSDRIVRQYYRLIDARVNNLLPTILSSNIPLDKIIDIFGDRIASRLGMIAEVKFPKKDLRRGMNI